MCSGGAVELEKAALLRFSVGVTTARPASSLGEALLRLRRRRTKKPMATATRAPTRAPIAMPALAPAERAGPREGGARA